MTLSDVTALMSRVGRANPKLMESREVALFVEAVIAEARKLPAGHAPPKAPCDIDPH